MHSFILHYEAIYTCRVNTFIIFMHVASFLKHGGIQCPEIVPTISLRKSNTETTYITSEVEGFLFPLHLIGVQSF